MPENTITAGGLLLATDDPRVKRVHALPWGVAGKTNLGPLSWNKGTVTIPRDQSILMANIGHDREKVVGRMFDVVETDQHLDLSVRIADTDEGDFLLAEIDAGRLDRFSVEIKNVVHKNGKAESGSLFGGAFTSTPAYEGAALYAEEAPPTEQTPAELAVEEVKKYIDPETGVLDLERYRTDHPDTPTDPDAAAAKPEPQKPADPAESEETVPDAQVPSTLAASTSTPNSMNLATLFAEVQKARGQDSEAARRIAQSGGDALFAALNDVKFDGTGGIAQGAGGLPQYVGEVWQARRRGRKILSRFAIKPMNSIEIKGWGWDVLPEVQPWAGNKSNVPSSTITPKPVEGKYQRFAGGNDFAREFADFGRYDVIIAAMGAYADSYGIKSEDWFFAQLLADAGTGTAVSAPAGTPAGLNKIVQGALQLINAEAVPSIAFVAPDVFAQIIWTKKDDTLEYLNASIGTDLTEGGTQGFSIVPTTGLAAGQVLVVDKRAADPYELPGVPIRVNALDMVKGGIDEAVFGYIGYMLNDATGLALIKNAA